MADRFRVRGAYLDETIAAVAPPLVGVDEPFHGRFHTIDDFAFAPLPVQGGALPIVVGGRAEPALRRAGSARRRLPLERHERREYAERVPVIRAAAEAAGRPLPWLSARATREFGAADDRYYAMRGTPEEIAAEVRAFAGLGVEHLALWFETDDPEALAAEAERFARESRRLSDPRTQWPPPPG